jgi:hypothetical protein
MMVHSSGGRRPSRHSGAKGRKEERNTVDPAGVKKRARPFKLTERRKEYETQNL